MIPNTRVYRLQFMHTLLLRMFNVCCWCFSGDHHHLPVSSGVAAALHGVSDSAGAHAQAPPVRALAAHPERR